MRRQPDCPTARRVRTSRRSHPSPIDTASGRVLHRAMAIRPSQRPFNVSYYARNRAQEIDRVRTRQAATLEFLRELRRVPCADCGGTFEPYQMDFDHRDPAQKSFQMTDGRAMLMNRDRLLAEIAKCDVICANCHAIRSARFRAERAVRQRASRPETRRHASRQRRSLPIRDLLLRLRDRPCMDCGNRYPPIAMEFDHRDPSMKRYNVAASWCRSIAWILEEAAKCDIVCRNCHRKRTFLTRAQRGSSSVRSERLPSKQDVAGSNPVSRSATQLRLIEEAAIRYAA
jgi:hypothetical protein